jgi:putative membrane protein
MNRHLFALTISVAVIGVSACHKGRETAARDSSRPGQSAPVKAIQDAAAGPVGLASSVADSHAAQDFVPAAAQADLYELQAAQIAVQRSKTPEVSGFAQMMIKDHTRSMADMKALLAKAQPAVLLPANWTTGGKG